MRYKNVYNYDSHHRFDLLCDPSASLYCIVSKNKRMDNMDDRPAEVCHPRVTYLNYESLHYETQGLKFFKKLSWNRTFCILMLFFKAATNPNCLRAQSLPGGAKQRSSRWLLHLPLCNEWCLDVSSTVVTIAASCLHHIFVFNSWIPLFKILFSFMFIKFLVLTWTQPTRKVTETFFDFVAWEYTHILRNFLLALSPCCRWARLLSRW